MNNKETIVRLTLDEYYYPFGSDRNASGMHNPEHFKFSLGVAVMASPGKAPDGETCLYCFGARRPSW